jgi:exodeoxyribonuclease-3
VISASIEGVRVLNLYVPNGSALASEKYPYTLEWLACLRRYLEVQEAVGKYGAFLRDVRRGFDWDGDECLFVTVDFTKPKIPVDPQIVGALDQRLRDVAREFDSATPFIFVENRFADEQRVIGSGSKRA